MQESRWKIAPRVALLACTVWAEMVSISQLLSSGEAGTSQATVALSAILVFGILLLVVLLPVAFFRVKLQDARERVHFQKVFTQLALSMRPRVMRTHAGGDRHCETLGIATRNVRDSTTCATRRGQSYA